MSAGASWLWPDHPIGKRESRTLREEHNALVNRHALALEELATSRAARDMERRLAAQGFLLEGMGGNLVAYVRRDDPTDPEIIERIHVGEGWEAERLSDVVTISIECLSDDVPEIDTTNTATLAEVLSALANPSEEYALLGTRLDNGLGDWQRWPTA